MCRRRRAPTLASTRGLLVIDVTLHCWCAAAWLSFVACAPAFAQDTSQQERRISHGVEIAFSSGHADRGFMLSDRPVVQPVLWLSGRGKSHFYIDPHFEFSAIVDRAVRAALIRPTYFLVRLTTGVEL